MQIHTLLALFGLSRGQQADPEPVWGLEFGFCPIGDDLKSHETVKNFDQIRF